ncbi:MAG: EpsG family protein [Enterococcus sp.]
MWTMSVTLIACLFAAFLYELEEERLRVFSSEEVFISYKPILYGFLFFLLLAVASFRTGFIDTPTYRRLFEEAGNQWTVLMEQGISFESEFGFVLLMNGLNKITDNSQILLFFCALVILGTAFYMIKRYSVDIIFSFLLFLFLEYVDGMNIVRQVFVGALFLLTLPLIQKKYFWRYVVVILLVSTIHMSAVICIPLYFLLRKRPSSVPILLLIGVGLALYLYPSLLEQIVEGFFGTSSKYATYFHESEWQYGISPFRLLVQGAPLCLLLIYEWKQRTAKKVDEEESPYYCIFANMMILNFLCNLLGSNMVILARVAAYFSFASVLMIPYLLQRLLTKESYAIVRWIVLLLYGLFFIYQLVSYQADGFLNGLEPIFWEVP